MKFQWEEIEQNPLGFTARAKVPDGWIVMNKTVFNDDDVNVFSQSMVFVPDKFHRWDIQ